MKLRRLITRRRAKWVGTVVLLLSLVAYVWSHWYSVRVIRATRRVEVVVYFESGALLGARSTSETDLFPIENSVTITRMDGSGLTLWYSYESRQIALTPTIVFSRRIVSFPLWLPLLLIAAPTAYLWRTDRRPKPWQCAKCRYDLRGLEGGVCPECGPGHQSGEV